MREKLFPKHLRLGPQRKTVSGGRPIGKPLRKIRKEYGEVPPPPKKGRSGREPPELGGNYLNWETNTPVALCQETGTGKEGLAPIIQADVDKEI